MMPLIQALIDVATGRIMHSFNGACPDGLENYRSRDPDCPACAVIVSVEHDRGMLINAEASASARVVDARTSLAWTAPAKAAAYERARVRLLQAELDHEAARKALGDAQ